MKTFTCCKCGDVLTEENSRPSARKISSSHICRKCTNIYSRIRLQRPETKEKRRVYLQEYFQRPEVKKRYCKGGIPVVDCLDKDRIVTFQEILDKSGAGRGYARRIFGGLVKIGLIEHLEPDSYRIKPDNPLRFAIDGYYSEKQKMMKGVKQ